MVALVSGILIDRGNQLTLTGMILSLLQEIKPCSRGGFSHVLQSSLLGMTNILQHISYW